MGTTFIANPARRFFDALFNAALDTDPRLAITITRIAETAQNDRFRSIAAGIDHLRSVSGTTDDLYAGCALYDIGAPPSRRRSEDTRAITALWLEADVADRRRSDTRKTYFTDKAAALQFIDALPLRPSILVETQGGFHLYWLLREPLIFRTAADREAAQRLEQAWWQYVARRAKALGVDLDPVHDLARILRIPGTRQHARWNGALVTLRDLQCLITYEPDTFGDLIHDAQVVQLPGSSVNGYGIQAAKGAEAIRSDPMATAPADELGALVLQNADFAAVWHRTTPRKSDSEYDFAIARHCLVAGWKSQMIADAIIHHRRVHTAAKPRKALDQRYLWRTIEKARQHIAAQADLRQHHRSGPSTADGPRKLRRGELTWRLATQLQKELHFAQDAGRKLHVYRNGLYVPTGERAVREAVRRLCAESGLQGYWYPTLGDDVVQLLLDDPKATPDLWESPPLGEINIANGILDVATCTLREHDPRFLSCVQFPVRYDPAASRAVWDKFISETFPKDATSLAYEILADLLRPDPSIQKAILLEGNGGNGKSAFLTGAVAFIGKHNTVAINLHKLENDRFAVARLRGKLANICPDLPSRHLEGSTVFKSLTGGDPLEGEYKFKDGFRFVAHCRLVFSANSYPRSADATEAFFDRWVVIPFRTTFRNTRGEIPRQVLDARLAAPEALSGLLNRVLAVLPALRGSHRFTESRITRAAVAEFRSATDPVTQWFEEHTVKKGFVPKDDLLRAYNRDAERAGRTDLTSHAMTRVVKQWCPTAQERQRTVRRKRVWCWIGLALREDATAT